MIYPRVNLLKKSERRYQGAVSQRFLLGGAIVVPVLFVVLVGMIQFVQYGNLKTELQSNREILEKLEPRLALHREKGKSLTSNRQVLDLLEGWEKSQASYPALMRDIQGVVPESIQFTRLSVRSDFKSSVYASVADLMPTYSLVIEGISQGEGAVNETTRLRENLMESTKISRVFDSVSLISMRKLGGDTDIDRREFRLEGAAMKEGGR